ncbi:MAG: peptidylprolyl isomerase [Actinomycetota bacterium]
MGTDKRERQKANRAKALEARARRERMDKIRRRGIKFGIGIPVVVIALFALARTTSDDSGANDIVDTTAISSTPETTPGDEITGATPCPKTDGSEKRVTTFEQAPPMCIENGKSYTATFDTSEGTIVVDLDTDKTPKTVNNFIVLSRYKYYDGSYIFRTDPSLDIIQGGGQDNTDGPGYVIEDEGNQFTYSAGDLVMARSSGPNSGGGQFFFVTGPNAKVLDYREGDPASQGTYVTFGKVTEGLDVTQAILALNEGEGNLGGAPSRPVQIRTVTITEK